MRISPRWIILYFREENIFISETHVQIVHVLYQTLWICLYLSNIRNTNTGYTQSIVCIKRQTYCETISSHRCTKCYMAFYSDHDNIYRISTAYLLRDEPSNDFTLVKIVYLVYVKETSKDTKLLRSIESLMNLFNFLKVNWWTIVLVKWSRTGLVRLQKRHTVKRWQYRNLEKSSKRDCPWSLERSKSEWDIKITFIVTIVKVFV